MAGSFFDGLLNSVQNPLFLGGVGLMGGGAQGLNQGLAAGNQFAAQRKKQAEQEAMQNGLMTMENLSPADKQILGASPELAADVLGKMYANKFDPMAGLDKRYKEAQIRKLEREPAGGELPSNVREWQYFNSLKPEDQQRYITMKRAEKYLDIGTGYVQPNPVAPGQNVRTVTKDLVGAERDKELGTAIGKAEGSAPSDLQAANEALYAIESIRNDKNMDWGVGLSSPVGNMIPKTPGYDFQNKVDQAKSGAFLTAIQSMRGLGALSNAEGDTATKAVTRMNTATSKEAFLSALADYERIVKNGKTKAEGIIAQRRARETQNAQPPATPQGGDPLSEAKAAIAAGADPQKVMQRLQQMGVDPRGLQ